MTARVKYIVLFLLWALIPISFYTVFARDASAPTGQDSTELVGIPAPQILQDTAVTQQAQPNSFLSRYRGRILVRFDKSPLFISILYVVIIYSIITLITLLIIILLNRGRMQREEKLLEYLNNEYQQKLMDYLFEEEKRDRALKDLERVASNRFNRQILINQMIDLSINLKGELRLLIKELYLLLGLKKDSLAKAYSKKWHENVKGFRELAFMNIREAKERILDSLNSSNEIVRMEAQIAMVRLSDDNPYHFLHFMDKPLAVWEQITLHELLIQHNLKVPAFKQWFESKNLSIVIFALEMVSWFKQKSAGKEIIKLLEHESDVVRHTAIKVFGDIQYKSSLPVLKKIYEGEPYKNKLEILLTFARIPDERYLNFLKSVLDMEEDVQLQIQATKAMENTDEPGISMLIKLMKSKSEYKNYQIIIRHVLDGRIY
ncbi:MAG: HEAT repeat domain-containing protein [Bacteroidales bacterium]|nr:HEAT repeat domain-containing protein [Bacteroidales bacterium]